MIAEAPPSPMGDHRARGQLRVFRSYVHPYNPTYQLTTDLEPKTARAHIGQRMTGETRRIKQAWHTLPRITSHKPTLHMPVKGSASWLGHEEHHWQRIT